MRKLLIFLLFFPLGVAGQTKGQLSGGLKGKLNCANAEENVRPADITAPSIDSAEIGRAADDTLYLFFDEAFNESYIPEKTSFTVSGVYGSPSVTYVELASDTL